jgi:hypothetical protein
MARDDCADCQVSVSAGRSAWTAEGLRRAALDALGPAADERALDALRRCAISLAPSVARWDASQGTVEAHRVTLSADAGTLGLLRSAPALIDALCAALAAVIATRPGEALLELSLRWAPGVCAATAGYRDAPPVATTLTEALEQYLDALGEGHLARMLQGAVVEAAEEQQEPVLLLAVDRETWEWLRAEGRATATLTRAAQDLLGSERARVRRGPR